ncbi:helix-turn-helix domain-containing protein [Streptosporangium sp. NBC_01639]|uniref:helix-turn-helix domain-containing protein n=1 Tax=Streptosporangium sp. NBC_01639 TaxID=2975948 RepID=UPI0038681F30|nr:helix-turn-helix domain-containing protein [Streptosporangium sp. NBC_01639]
MAYGHKTEQRLRVRAHVVLHAARGRSNARIARETGLHLDTVRRWLAEDALKPWRHRSWIFITDPQFRPKAQRVLDPYARTWQGEPLGEGEYVISADEKTSIQARCRCHPALAPGQARAMRVNHPYGRGGALAYLTAYDVHHAKVFGRCEPRTGINPFMNLVAQVMAQEPYASAKRVFWIVDNGSSHRGQKAADLSGRRGVDHDRDGFTGTPGPA